MCQLCILNTMGRRDRWPDPLRGSRVVLDSIIATAHREAVVFYSLEAHAKATRSAAGPSTEPDFISTAPASPPRVDGDDESLDAAKRSLLTTLSTLFAALSLLEAERSEWWTSKATLRKQWEEQLLITKITAQQVINNKTRQMIMDMQAHVGKFARWGLGVRDVEALETVAEGGKENGVADNAALGLTRAQDPTAASAQQTGDRDTRSKKAPAAEGCAAASEERSCLMLGQSGAEKLKKLQNARKLQEMIEGQVL